ncbi:MAG TPA: hypothetical protein VKT82_28270 [Ktedonobacterales bacterium]|nr:hypothetical protein [Ktedonobacterales bacterium]
MNQRTLRANKNCVQKSDLTTALTTSRARGTIPFADSFSLVGDDIFDAHTGNMLEWGAAQSINDGI